MAKDVSSSTLGVITEQGDLGLGFEPVTAQEQAQVEQNDQDQSQEQ